MSTAAPIANPQSATNSKTERQARSPMNAVLWTLQALSGVFWSITGFGKMLCYNSSVWNQTRHDVSWFSAIPQGLFVFIGVCEFLGGVGLVLPAMTRVKPKLTAFAALGLALVMILAMGFHIARGEYNFLPTNLVLGGIAVFIAYGRLLMRPVMPASMSTFRVLKGLLVFAALVLVALAPVLYKLTHTR